MLGGEAPENHGLDPDYLARADRYAREEAPQIAAMLVVRHGLIVFERYYHDYSEASWFSLASVTKSVLSALVGIALRDGLLSGVDQPIARYFPQADTHGLTLRHLLTLTAGWPYHDFDQRPMTVPDMLAEPRATPPGQRFQYGETPPHLVSAILSQLTGVSAAEYARRELFGPLGMWREAERWRDAPGTRQYHGHWPDDDLPWTCDANGISNGGFGLHLTVRDLARFGLLYARGGLCDGRQLVPADYLAASTTPQSRGGSPMWAPYGCFWWLPTWHRGQPFMAAGFGGQLLYVNTDLDLIIAIACATRLEAPSNGGILYRYLLPALMSF
ncbi:MAG TPA: serine hydrolase [Chloroflexota bacterium]